MNMSRARGPRYSLEYLTFIATKRKQREGGGDREEGTKDDWETSAKRPRVVAPTVTETMREVWKEMKTDGYVV
jgi:chromatin structure-remodeling complex subunit RSC1/2